MIITPDEFEASFPQACAWVEEQERFILSKGVSLSPGQLADAISIGIAHPEKVRLLKVERVPEDPDPAVQATAQKMGINSPDTLGRTFGYGIFIRKECWGARALVAHELVHTLQYERLGGIQQFLRQYLNEINTVGYAKAPLEKEAYEVMARFT